ncbi:hypothetical protein K439DRAFT_1650095 [Ramaria rubella]|nr:hypothetical protein K439DRAFT_1650095 [Ramaria rubella]
MECVRDILNNTVTLSWLNPMPYNFGESAAGLLKADEWHTLSTMYLPLTLCLIRILQRQPSNHKFYKNMARELETTMLQAFIRGAKLRRWLGRPDCPPALKECKKLFEKAYSQKGYQYAGTQDDADDTLLQSKTFPEDLQHLLNTMVFLVQFYPGGNKNSLPLYSPKLSGQLEVIEVDWVVSHYARWPISLEHVIVLSLSCD